MVEVDVVSSETDQLADAQTMSVRRKDQEMIADPVPARFGGVEQGSDFGLAQKILAPLMGVRGGRRDTFYISPVGQPLYFAVSSRRIIAERPGPSSGVSSRGSRSFSRSWAASISNSAVSVMKRRC